MIACNWQDMSIGSNWEACIDGSFLEDKTHAFSHVGYKLSLDQWYKYQIWYHGSQIRGAQWSYP